MKKVITIFLTALLSCSEPQPAEETESVYLSPGSAPYLVEEFPSSEKIRLTTETTASESKIFFLFTNTLGVKNSVPVINTNLTPSENRKSTNPSPESRTIPFPLKNRVFKGNTPTRLLTEPVYSQLSQRNFTVYDTYLGFREIQATCRSVLETSVAGVSIYLWVDNEEMYAPDNPDSTGTITSSMTIMLNTYIEIIYDSLAHLLGVPWGPGTETGILPETWDDIHILLTDIDRDKDLPVYSYITGYFYALNNYLKGPGTEASNEMLLLTIDAPLFSKLTDTESEWSIENYWPQEIITTLGHEFQHMIHFYQKSIKNSLQDTSEVWIDEMCSLATEDILSNSLLVNGPRGTKEKIIPDMSYSGEGRLPLFNQVGNIDLTQWNYSYILENYASAYALGAYILRVYGIEGIKQIIQSDKTDYKALEEATGLSFSTILKNWACAVALSSYIEAPPLWQYNNGGWFTDGDYKYGSINLNRYSFNGSTGYKGVPLSQLPYYTSTAPYSNLIVTENLAPGSRFWEIDLTSSMDLTVIITNNRD